jgi:hypothetical protein
MEIVLVTVIVLIASLVLVRHLWKKFSVPQNPCSGNCCGCNQSVNQKEKN